jgi:CRP-like cAMP-binding protein
MNLEYTRIIGAVLLAVLAMSSLIIGVVIGLYAKPSRRTTAIVMAFGTGALIHALAVELAFEGAERLLHESHLAGFTAWACVALGFTAGGVLYYIGDRRLEHYGAALRHPSLSKLYLARQKHEKSAALLAQLSRVELLRALPPEEMEDVMLCVQPVNFPAGATIFRRGEAGDALYLIVSGSVAVRSDNGDGHLSAQPLATLGEGQSFGEMALLTGEHRTAAVTTESEVELLKIAKEHFDELTDRSHALRLAVETLNSQRLLKNASAGIDRTDADEWQKRALANMSRLSHKETAALLAQHAAAGAPLALFLGAMLDGIPESLVIGADFISLEKFEFTFLAAVFLSNLPEAIGSSMGMRAAGFSQKRIFTLWILLLVAGAVAAGLGNIFLSGASPVTLTFVGALAGGGILAMVASVMMPEAYENGGAAVGLATIAGFLTAFLFTLV